MKFEKNIIQMQKGVLKTYSPVNWLLSSHKID